MNYRTAEDKTQGNQTAERYLALLEEYGTYEDRLQKALAHKEAFSEKVLAKVSGEYKSKMDQLKKERSSLEAQLQAELSAFERQLQVALPARQRYHEEVEELELRHLTGELATKDYTRRKAALEEQKPGGAATEALQRNIDYYRAVLQGSHGAGTHMAAERESVVEEELQELPPVEQPAADDWQAMDVEEPVMDLEPEVFEAQEPDPAGAGWGEAVHETPEADVYGAPSGELQAEEDYFATHLADAEPDTEGSFSVPDSGEDYSVETFTEAEPQDEEAYYHPGAVAEELGAEDAFYSEIGEPEEGDDSDFAALAAAPEAQEEEEFFQSEFDEATHTTSDPDWYAQQGQGDAGYGGRVQQEADGALEDLDEFADDSGFAQDDVEIPEELLMDDDEDFLQQESMEDSAALLQSTDRLLADEAFEDVFEEDLVDGDTNARTLEPAMVIREGMPDEKVFFMTNNVLSIGRGPDNDIQLSTDTSVSRHHSRITYEDDEYWIADLGSSNGTIVNGARVSKTVLTGDDEISIGQTVLKFKFL